LEKGLATFEEDIGAASEVGCLLEKDGVGTIDFADVYNDFLL
jgi:hypothetical protein